MTQSGIGRPMTNPFTRNHGILVSRIASGSDIKESIMRSVALIGGFEKVIERGDEVLLKPNFNTADPPPASSDPKFLRAVVDLLYEHGASRVVLGESSMQTLSTREVMAKAGALEELKDGGVETAFFDEEEWVKVDVGGEYLKHVSLAKRALQMKKVVYCCCMKTHRWADFSFSLKLAMGFMRGSERLAFHFKHLKEKLVDLNLVVHPSLILMDGRKCFIAGGPLSGEVRDPNLVLASGDRVAIDIESIKVVQSFQGAKLAGDPWSYAQIRHAVKLGLGVKSEKEYDVVSR